VPVTNEMFDVLSQVCFNSLSVLFVLSLCFVQGFHEVDLYVASKFVNKNDSISVAMDRLRIDGAFLVGVPGVADTNVLVTWLFTVLRSFSLPFCSFAWCTFGTRDPIRHGEVIRESVNEIMFCHLDDDARVDISKKAVTSVDICVGGKRRGLY